MFAIADTYRFEFSTRDPDTRALADADSTPTATLVVNGADDVASVTVTDSGTGRYKGSVSLATLSVGDVFYVRVSATSSGLTDEWQTPTARVTAAATDSSGDAIATAADLTTVDGVVDAIKAVTDAVPDGGALTALLASIASILADTDELQQDDVPGLIAALNNVSAAAVRDAILDRVAAGNHDTAGTVGLLLQYLDAAITSRSSHTAEDVNTAVEGGQVGTDAAAIKAKTDNLPASPAATGDIPTVAEIEAALVNEGDATALMQAIADKIAGDLTAADVTAQAIATATRDAILDRVLATNHDTAGTPGKLLQDISAGDLGDLALIVSVLAGKRTVTDNGNATKTVRCFAADGTTPKADLTFNANGEITVVALDP